MKRGNLSIINSTMKHRAIQSQSEICLLQEKNQKLLSICKEAHELLGRIIKESVDTTQNP